MVGRMPARLVGRELVRSDGGAGDRRAGRETNAGNYGLGMRVKDLGIEKLVESW